MEFNFVYLDNIKKTSYRDRGLHIFQDCTSNFIIIHMYIIKGTYTETLPLGQVMY